MEANRGESIAPRAFRPRSLGERRVAADGEAAGTLHYVATCTQCGFNFCDESVWELNEAEVEKKYSVGTALSEWGCDAWRSSPSAVTVVRNSCTGDVYVAEAPVYTTTTAPPVVAKVSAQEWDSFLRLRTLRSQGFTCPEGQTYPPNTELLQFDCLLWKAARLHSQDMADHGYFSHTSQDGRSMSDRARDVGATWIRLSEILGAGSRMIDGNSVLTTFQNANGQCLNMMDPTFKVVGSGHGSNANSPYKNYWTQMFSDLTSPADTSCYP